MTVTTMEILGSDGADRPILPLTRATRDALAKYVALKAPTGRRKWAQAEWDLSPDEARGVCEATASATTIDKVWKHPRGGWAVLLPVMGAVIGQPAHEFFRQQIRNAADEQARAQEHERLARAAYARLADRFAVGSGDAGDDAPAARQAGRGLGALGSDETRRVGER